MNKTLKKVTGIVTTGAIVLSLGTGAMMISNTRVSAAAIDEEVQSQVEMKSFRNIQRQRPEATEGMEAIGGSNRNASMEDVGVSNRNASMKEMKNEGRDNKSRREDKGQLDLTALVDEDLLSEDQLAEIETFKEELAADREAEKALVEEMTEEEKEAYIEERKAEEKPKLFDALVEEGILETSEAQDIVTYLEEQRNDQKELMMTDKLEPLVTDGTLTSSDVTAIVDYLNDMEPREKPVKGEDVLDQEERVSPFDEMVSESIITEAQALAIEELMQPTKRARR